MIVFVFVQVLLYGVLSATQELNFFYTTEAAKQHVNYFNSLIKELENDLSQNLYNEMMFSSLNVNIEQYRAELERAFSYSANDCISGAVNLNVYEESAYLNLKQCEKQVSSEIFKEIVNAVKNIIIKFQFIESKTKNLIDACGGDQSCENEVLANNQLEVEQLFWGAKNRFDDLYANTKSLIFNYFHSCVVNINNPLLGDIEQKLQDLKTCIETSIEV